VISSRRSLALLPAALVSLPAAPLPHPVQPAGVSRPVGLPGW